MREFLPYLLFTVLAVNISCIPRQKAEDSHIPQPVLFNHPGLMVDLGVGLWAWPLPMDYDGDGDMDLLVSCPDTPFSGVYFFENPSGGKEKMPVFLPPVRLGPGEMNLQVSYTNGKARLLGRGLEYLNFREKGVADPQILFPKDSLEKDYTRIRFSQWKYVDYENDGDFDLIVGLDEWGNYGWDNAFDSLGNWTRGPLHGYVYLLENENGEFINKGKLEAGDEPIDVYGAPSPNMEDFDGDGDLDLICGEFIDRLTWFENIGTRQNPVFASGKFLENREGIIRMDLQMIVPVAVDWDQDGDMDLVVGDEDGRVAFIENTGDVKHNMPVFHSPVYFKQQADRLKFGALVTPVSVDWDGDGDEDLVCGNTAGYIGFIENLDGGNPPKWNNPVLLEAEGTPIRIIAGEKGSIQGPAERKWGYTTVGVADWDHDGLMDIIVNSIWGRVEWYKNTGSRNKPALASAQPVIVEWKGEPSYPEWNWWEPEPGNLVTQWRTTPFVTDWNGDGLMDLIMLDHEGYLAYFERYMNGDILLLKAGQRIFYSEPYSAFDGKSNPMDSVPGILRLNACEAGASGRRKFCLADWDGDGDTDLLVNSSNIAWFENLGREEGFWKLHYRGNILETKLAGHTTSPTMVDWNRDGTLELLIGAEDGHFYYYPGQQQKKDKK